VADDPNETLASLERRIAADTYTIELVHAVAGTEASKASLERALRARIAEAVAGVEAIRRATEAAAAQEEPRPKRTRSRAKPAGDAEPPPE